MNRVHWGVLVGVALSSGYLVVTTIAAVLRDQQPFPLYDQWASVMEARWLDEGRFGFEQIFRQHNEHRLAVPRLFFIADLWLCSQQGQVLTLSSVLFQGLHAGLLVVVLRGAKPIDGLWMAAVPVVIAFMYCSAQVENLIAPFQIQFILVFMAATAGFAALARASTSRRPWIWISAACLGAVTSTYSMANGLLAWPLLLIMALRLQLSRRIVAILAATGAVAVITYLYGYSVPGHHTNPSTALGHPLAVVEYFACLLGGVIRFSDCIEQLALGATLCALALPMLSWEILSVFGRRARIADPWRLAAACIGAFAMGSAGLIALGRFSYPLELAASARYGTPAMMFWAASVIMGVTRRPGWLRRGTLLLGGAVFFSLLLQQEVALENNRNYRRLIRQQGTGMETGVQDRIGMSCISDPDFVWNECAGIMIDGELSVFSGGRHKSIGRTVDARILQQPPACLGACDQLTFVRDSGWAFVARGWALPQNSHSRAVTGLFVDSRSVVVGLADFDNYRPDLVALVPETAGKRVEFHGYGTVAADSGEITLVVLTETGDFLRCGWSASIATELAVDLGEPISGLSAQTKGEFAEVPIERLPSGQRAGPRVLVSEGLGEARVGPVFGTRELVLPLLLGPIPFGISVEIVEHDTGRLLRSLWPATTLGEWRYWRVTLPSDDSVRSFDIVVKDSASRAGQFVMIGLPTSGR